jgi:phospholipase/lecithinase/hemolysin
MWVHWQLPARHTRPQPAGLVTPFAQSTGAGPGFSVNFNTAPQLDGLDLLFPDAGIVLFDTFSFLNDAVLNPTDYGLANSQTPACPHCAASRPENYVFWDVFHPTTRADAIIASAFAKAAQPEPSRFRYVRF